MKKLLGFLVFTVMLVACGSYTPKAGDTTNVVAKIVLMRMLKEKWNNLLDVFNLNQKKKNKNL